VEYASQTEFQAKPNKLNNKVLHPEGKNNQLLGFTVHSTALIDGTAMVVHEGGMKYANLASDI